jgi:hypothetical protein
MDHERFFKDYYGREWRELLNRLDHGGPYDEAIRKASVDAENAKDYLYQNPLSVRENLVRLFAWAIPNREAVNRIAKESPIVEMGAGTGYWAKLLRDEGADVVSYDAAPPPSAANQWHDSDGVVPVKLWSPVEIGTPNALVQHQDRALFLCWPPYSTPMAAECLTHWKGKTLLIVGEGNGGCTADDDFWEELERSFDEVEVIDIPRWMGLHDALYVFQRRR